MSTVLSESSLTDNTHPMQQVAGRLIYHTNGQNATDSTTVMELVDFNPSLENSWSMQVEVTIPDGARIENPGNDSECFIIIGCYSQKDGILRGFTTEYKLSQSGTREVKASSSVDDQEPFADESTFKVFEETHKIKISYFAGSFTLFSSNLGSGSDLLLMVDIDPEGVNLVPNIHDWGLESTDTVTLFIGANSNNYPITPERPLQLDNLYYIQHFGDTEPGEISVNQDLLSVDVKSFPSGQSELQKSHDLENWITIKTMARGIHETLFLPSDDGKAHYRVIGEQ